MINIRDSIISSTLTLALFLLFTQSSLGGSLFRLKPSTPKDLLEGVYNNVLAGNDRLSDIENYMNAGLRADYKRAVKISKKGGKCDLPRILSNGIFSQKLKGFQVETDNGSAWTTQAKVILDTGANNLPATSVLKKFDPKIYEAVTFFLKRRFVDWKIDNIQASTPDVDDVSSGVNYKVMDLREALRSCK